MNCNISIASLGIQLGGELLFHLPVAGVRGTVQMLDDEEPYPLDAERPRKARLSSAGNVHFL